MVRQLLFLMFVVVAAAELVDYRPCENVDAAKCAVSDVHITPCSSKKSCRLKRGGEAAITFDFVPSFSADKLNTTVFWASNFGDLPWMDLDSDACKVTPCPCEAGKSQRYDYSLHLGKKLPEGKYTLKWTVSDAADITNICCFMANIQIKK